jgi:hypothetical protein
VGLIQMVWFPSTHAACGERSSGMRLKVEMGGPRPTSPGAHRCYRLDGQRPRPFFVPQGDLGAGRRKDKRSQGQFFPGALALPSPAQQTIMADNSCGDFL